MPGVLEAIRKKYPQYADVPDEKLGPAIVAKYPQYLERDPSLKQFSPVATRASDSLPAPAGAPTPATPSPVAAGTISDSAGFLDAFSRGWKRLTQTYSQTQTGTSGTTIRQERQGYERAMQDPRYFEQSDVPPWQMNPLTGQPRNQARTARVEGTVGPAGQTEQVARNRQTRRETAVADIAATEAELREAPKSAGMAELANAKTTADKWKAWAKNPIEITSQITAESLVRSTPGIAAMAAAGPAGIGAGSFVNEMSSGVLESAQEQGFDVADPKQLQAFLDNPKARAEAQGYALKRASVIGAIDAATAGAAGQILSRTLGKGMAKVGAGVVGEAGLQAAGGAGGEALAQTATGKPLDSFEIAMEAIAEIASAPAEVVSNLRKEIGNRKSEIGNSSVGPAQTQGEAGAVGGGANQIQPLPEPAAVAPAPTSLPAVNPELDAEAAAIEAMLAERASVAPVAPERVGERVSEGVGEPSPDDLEYAGGEMPRGNAVAFEAPTTAPKVGRVSPNPDELSVGDVIQASDAEALLAKIRAGDERSKHRGQASKHSYENGPLTVVDLPLAELRAEHVQFLRDSTDAERVARYKSQDIKTPVYAVPSDRGGMRIVDGGHRTLAAIAAGRSTVRALVPVGVAAQIPQAASPVAGGAATQAAGLVTAPDEGIPQQSGPTPPTQAAPERLPDSPDVLKFQSRIRALEDRLQTAIEQGHSTKPATERIRTRLMKARADLKDAVAKAAKPKRKRVARGISQTRVRFDNETARSGEDILSFIRDNGRLISPTAAKEKGKDWWAANKSEYDDAPGRLPPHHNAIYSDNGSTPDVVAQAAYERGLIPEATPGALWKAIGDASTQRLTGKAAETIESKVLENEAAQAMEWGKAIEDGAVRVDTGELAVGDLLEVEGERVEVVEVNTDTGWITLKDGRKFGVQRLPNDSVIYVEQWQKMEEESGSAIEPAVPAFYKGQMVKFSGGPAVVYEKGKPKTIERKLAGRIERFLPNGDLEIRSQGAGIFKRPPSQVTAAEAATPSPVAKAWEEVKEAYLDAGNPFIAYDPKRDAAQMFRLYTALAKLAAVMAKQGVKTAAEFAAKIGRKLDAMIQKAWDDAQAGTVAKTIDELADDVKQVALDNARERQFSLRMAADERLDPAFREATGNRTYQPVPNLQTYSEAMALVQERGIDGALLALKDEHNGIEPRVRVLIGQAIITQSNHEFAQSKNEAALDRGVDAAEWLTEFGTRLGQGVQAFAVWSRLTPEGIGRAYVRSVERMNDKATRGMTPIQKAKAKLKLPKVDPDIEAEVRTRARKALAKPEGFQRDEAMIDVLQFIQRKTEPVRWWDTLFALWYANILSGWTTQTINVASTAANIMAEATAHMAANPKDAARILTGLADGGFRGMWDALAILQTGKVTGTRMQKLELPRVLERVRFTGGYLNPLNYAKFVSRVMAASDMVFFRSAEEMKGRIAARRIAQDEKLTGRALSRRVYEILHNTPALREQARVKALAEGHKQGSRDYFRRYYELIEQARPAELRTNAAEFGRTATFNQQPHGVLGLIANTLATLGRKLPPFKLIVPFTHVVSNVTNRALNFTPYGYKRLFWGHFVEKADADRPDFGTEEWNVQFARATIGTTLLSALAAAALQNLDDEDPPFMVYGKGPLDPRRGYQLRQSGWRPYSIKVGNQYYNYLGTPLHLGLALVGNYIDAYRYQGMAEHEVTARLAYAIKSAGRTLLDQSFLTGLKDFLIAITQGGVPTKDPLAGIGSRVAGAAIPNLVKQVDAIFDPTIYTAEDLQTALLRDLPVVRHHSELKPMLNVLGAPVRRDRMERFVSPEINDPVWRMISAKQAWIGSPSTTTKLGDRDMTPDELYEYVRLSGPRIRRRLEAELAQLNAMPREQAQARVESIVRQERAAAREQLRAQMYR